MSKQDLIIIITCILLIIGLLAASPYLPDTRTGAIRRTLARQGHDVESVGFEFISDREGYRGWIFQSSEPLYLNGLYVNQWLVVSYSLGAWPPIRYFVQPYPSPVSITISFTAEEFEQISERADGQPIKGYLRHIIHGNLG